jgi:hypothetical protein
MSDEGHDVRSRRKIEHPHVERINEALEDGQRSRQRVGAVEDGERAREEQRAGGSREHGSEGMRPRLSKEQKAAKRR